MSPCAYDLLPFYLVRVVSEIFNVEKCHDIEIGVKLVDHSRSLKMVIFDKLYMVSY